MDFETMQRYDACCDCGKRLSPTRRRTWFVNYNESTGYLILPDATPEGDEWGLLPIGRECAKRLPKEYLIDGATLRPLRLGTPSPVSKLAQQSIRTFWKGYVVYKDLLSRIHL